MKLTGTIEKLTLDSKGQMKLLMTVSIAKHSMEVLAEMVGYDALEVTFTDRRLRLPETKERAA